MLPRDVPSEAAAPPGRPLGALAGAPAAAAAAAGPPPAHRPAGGHQGQEHRWKGWGLGVSLNKKIKRFKARIQHKKHTLYLNSWRTAHEARLAYDLAARLLGKSRTNYRPNEYPGFSDERIERRVLAFLARGGDAGQADSGSTTDGSGGGGSGDEGSSELGVAQHAAMASAAAAAVAAAAAAAAAAGAGASGHAAAAIAAVGGGAGASELEAWSGGYAVPLGPPSALPGLPVSAPEPTGALGESAPWAPFGGSGVLLAPPAACWSLPGASAGAAATAEATGAPPVAAATSPAWAAGGLDLDVHPAQAAPGPEAWAWPFELLPGSAAAPLPGASDNDPFSWGLPLGGASPEGLHMAWALSALEEDEPSLLVGGLLGGNALLPAFPEQPPAAGAAAAAVVTPAAAAAAAAALPGAPALQPPPGAVVGSPACSIFGSRLDLAGAASFAEAAIVAVADLCCSLEAVAAEHGSHGTDEVVRWLTTFEQQSTPAAASPVSAAVCALVSAMAAALLAPPQEAAQLRAGAQQAAGATGSATAPTDARSMLSFLDLLMQALLELHQHINACGGGSLDAACQQWLQALRQRADTPAAALVCALGGEMCR